MPTNILPPQTPPIPRFTPASGLLVGPADGDPLVALSVNQAFIPLADRTTLAFNGLSGVYGSRMVASCDDGLNIDINPQAAVRSSSGVLSGTVGSPIDIAAVLGSAPVADTWYYVYGSDVLGVLTPVISTDPPDSAIKYRSGNADHVFLTLFRTDGAADVRPFTHYDGTYVYNDGFNVLSGGTATINTTIPLPDVPPLASIAILNALVTNTSTTVSPVFQVKKPGASDGYAVVAGLSPDGTTQILAPYALSDTPITSAGFVYQAVLIDPGESTLNIELRGFRV
jgi:hypothetical protein